MEARARFGKWGRAALGCALLLNLLDLTTTIIDSPVDRSYRPPPREPWEWALQIALLVPLLVIVARRARSWASALWSLPIPRPAFVACGLFLAVEAGHIALRYEAFPFSPVAMYSNGVTTPPAPVVEAWRYVIVNREGKQEVLSLERESTFLGKYLSDFDYRMTAAATMYSRTRVVFALVRDRLAEVGLGEPVIVRMRYDVRTGQPIPGKVERYIVNDAPPPRPRAAGGAR